MSNRAEYAAGTDPANNPSYLKIEGSVVPGDASVQFASVSNRTYTIQFRDDLNTGGWSRFVDLAARPTNVVYRLTDPNWTTNRFYQVAAPRQP